MHVIFFLLITFQKYSVSSLVQDTLDTFITYLYVNMSEKPPHKRVKTFQPFLMKGFSKFRCLHFYQFYIAIFGFRTIQVVIKMVSPVQGQLSV